jgi:serine/threonine protein kinase
MICAHCGSETAEAPCSGCARSPLLGGRYRLLATVEQGEHERVYRGEDSRGGGAVLLRRIDTRRVKAADLGRALDAHLKPLFRIHHPGLPRRRRSETTQRAAWMVRRWVDGPSLPDRVLRNGAFSLQDAVETTDRILEDLEVLHEQSPPIPHGALRPGNVRFNDKGRPVLLGRMGTRALLGDPGHPQRTLREDTTGLAPEQRGGEASVGADLYAAGALCITMLTGRPASSLERGGRIAWEQAVSLPSTLGRWLDRMIDPAPGRRPGSAAAARQRLTDARASLPEALLAHPAPLRRAAAPVDEELPTMVMRDELPTTMMQSPMLEERRPRWPRPDATPTSSGRRPAPADLAPTSIGRRPTADEIAAAEPTTMRPRLTREDIAAAEPTNMGRRPSRAELAASEPTTVGRSLSRADLEPTTMGPGLATRERTGDAPTDSAHRPGHNPFDPPTGFARRASEIEHTGPRPPTQVRPPSAPARNSAFENPVFVAVGLALLGVALWQVVSRLTG